tara:strand:- start:241 stop:981 length:741 start_codon:yes stop_codon:yes gene_type:complete
MPSKKRDWAKEQALRFEARLGIGKSDKRWREMNFLSQQNCHDWAKAAGVPLHNSQVAYWERGTLDPKGEFWFAREAYNFAIAENNFPASLSRVVKDRMKAAEPYLNHKGEVATALDFQAMFGNRQPINPLYTKAEELTNDFLAEFAQQIERTFKKVARENMFSNKECWDALCQTKAMKQVKDKKVASLVQDVLRGERIPTIEEARFVIGKYKQCPACIGLKDMTTGELSNKIEEANSKLVLLASAK